MDLLAALVATEMRQKAISIEEVLDRRSVCVWRACALIVVWMEGIVLFAGIIVEVFVFPEVRWTTGLLLFMAALPLVSVPLILVALEVRVARSFPRRTATDGRTLRVETAVSCEEFNLAECRWWLGHSGQDSLGHLLCRQEAIVVETAACRVACGYAGADRKRWEEIFVDAGVSRKSKPKDLQVQVCIGVCVLVFGSVVSGLAGEMIGGRELMKRFAFGSGCVGVLAIVMLSAMDAYYFRKGERGRVGGVVMLYMMFAAWPVIGAQCSLLVKVAYCCCNGMVGHWVTGRVKARDLSAEK